MGLLLLRPHDRPMVAWLEENGTGKDGERQRKKREEMERNDLGWKKTERGEPTGSPYPVNSSFRSPLTIWGKKAQELGYDLHTPEGNTRMARYLFDNYGSVPWHSSAACWNRLS
jgi:hypothetical protein